MVDENKESKKTKTKIKFRTTVEWYDSDRHFHSNRIMSRSIFGRVLVLLLVLLGLSLIKHLFSII